MLTIQKTISLEPITSRLPSIWPSYKGDKLYFFDDVSLKDEKRNYEYPTNYGMIPLNVSLKSNGEIGCDGDETMSFEYISKCYSFFGKYKWLLMHGGKCGLSYSSATDYYDTEINNKYVDDLVYGNKRETYEELDAKFKELGGNTFYNKIVKYIIPTFRFTDEIYKYSKYWGKDTLYYSDVIKWISWFKEREGYETEASYTSATAIDAEHWDCKKDGVKDCCDCEEYFNRGGKRTLDKMVEWYNTIQQTISGYKDIILDDDGNVRPCFTPSINDHIELVNSLDNIGQFSILSPQYEVGIDYRGSEYGDSANTRSGTTVIDDEGNTLLLKQGGKGFCFSSDYMEKIFNVEDWDDYTVKYISESENHAEFVSRGYDFYAFDDENRMYTARRTKENVKSAMKKADVYDLIKTDAIVIDNAMFELEEGEFGIYDPANTYSSLSGREFFVERESNTTTPYTVINGKKIYAESYLSGNGIVYYFTFFKNPNYTPQNATACHDNGDTFDINKYQIFTRIPRNQKSYISYNNKTFIFDNPSISSITIDGIEYPRINGYAHDKYGDVMYTRSNDDKVYDSSFIEISSEIASIHGNEIWVSKWDDNIKIYSANTIVGKTISRLRDLEAKNKLVDDTGNDINGLFNDSCKAINNIVNGSGATYAQPPIYTVLEPLYQVGNTSLIAKFKLTKEKQSEIVDNTNYFVGNIITEMVFYYKDVLGNVAAKGIASMDKSSLSAITDADINKKNAESQNGTIFQDDLFCDITYHIGATLQRKKEEPFKLAEGNYNHGVEYNETVKFVKTPTFYRLKTEANESDVEHTQKYTTENLAHKYVIYTYELEQDTETVESDSYGVSYEVPKATFKSEINIIKKVSTTNFSKFNDMEDYDGINISPTFMEEHKLGLAMIEKVDSDIYIDRGINSAFEKHLKLGEVTSLETLTQMGNGFFKVMDS